MVLFAFANIIAISYIPYFGFNLAMFSFVVFLLLDGCLLALDLKAAEQRVQDLSIFKSNEMIFLITKATENQELLTAISKRLCSLEKNRGLILPSTTSISDTLTMMEGGWLKTGCYFEDRVI